MSSPQGEQHYICICHESRQNERKTRGRPEKCLHRFFKKTLNRQGAGVIVQPVKRGRPPVPLPTLEECRQSPYFNPYPPKRGRPRKNGPKAFPHQQHHQHHHHHHHHHPPSPPYEPLTDEEEEEMQEERDNENRESLEINLSEEETEEEDIPMIHPQELPQLPPSPLPQLPPSPLPQLPPSPLPPPPSQETIFSPYSVDSPFKSEMRHFIENTIHEWEVEEEDEIKCIMDFIKEEDENPDSPQELTETVSPVPLLPSPDFNHIYSV